MPACLYRVWDIPWPVFSVTIATPRYQAQDFGRLRAELAYSVGQDILDHGLHDFLDTLQTKLNWECHGRAAV